MIIKPTCHELSQQQKLGFEIDGCDWCHQDYPKGTDGIYYYVEVFGKPHKICSHCYEHLEVVTQ